MPAQWAGASELAPLKLRLVRIHGRALQECLLQGPWLLPVIDYQFLTLGIGA